VNAEDVDDAALDELVGQNHDPTLRPFAARCFMAGRAVRYQELQAVRALLAAAERLIIAHHSTTVHRAPPGTICQVCAGEHEAVQAIWRELHET
jgi:hypothetical protein